MTVGCHQLWHQVEAAVIQVKAALDAKQRRMKTACRLRLRAALKVLEYQREELIACVDALEASGRMCVLAGVELAASIDIDCHLLSSAPQWTCVSVLVDVHCNVDGVRAALASMSYVSADAGGPVVAVSGSGLRWFMVGDSPSARAHNVLTFVLADARGHVWDTICLLYTSPSPRD